MRILKKLLVGLVILWGLLALLVRAATPFISDYREQLAALAAERLGAPVEIGGLEARWYGLRPLLDFNRVRIGQPGGETIEVERVSLDLSAAGLLAGSLTDALRVTIDGMQLTVVREPTGQLRAEGIGVLAAGRGTARPGLLGLPGHVQLLNTRVVWVDRKADRPPVPIDRLAILLDRDGSLLRLRAGLETGTGRAELAARFDGLPTATDWNAHTYLRVSGLDVAELFAPYMPARYGLRSMRLDLEAWGRWENAAPVHTQGRFQLRDLDLRPTAADAAPLEVWQAGGRFSIDRGPRGLRIGLKGLQLTFHDHAWPTGDLAFSVAPRADGGSHVEAAADFLRIEDVIRVLQVRLPWPGLAEPLAQLRPRGEVRGLRVSADLGPARPVWRARARFDGVAVEPFERTPGVTNLAGELHAQQDHLRLTLDSRDATLDYGRLFRAPIELRRLQGLVDLAALDDGWQLSTDRLLAVSPHINTETRLRLDHRPGQPPFLDLQTDFRDGDAASAGGYYPVGIMKDKLVAWLDRAIVGGRITRGTALLYGPLDDFAFGKTRSGVFQVVFDAEDMVLDYREGWPRIEQLAAHLRFRGNQLDIDDAVGSIYDSRMVGVHAHIANLNPVSPIRITGRLDGPLQNTLRVLGEPALAPRFRELVDGLRGEGDTRLALDLTIPLSRQGEYALDGRLELGGNRLSLPEWDLTLDGIDGRLGFTLDGVSASGIRARLLDTPVRIDVRPLADGSTRVDARGRFDTAAIVGRFPAIPSGLLAGATDLGIRLEIPRRGGSGDRTPLLAIESDLEGMAMALPPPLGKEAAQRRPFAVRLPLGEGAPPGSLDYAGQVSAKFGRGDGRVDVALGGGQAQLQAAPGIRVTGHLEELDLIAWGRAVAALGGAAGPPQPPLSADLRIDRLRADTVTLRQLHLAAARDQGLWQGRIDAPNLAGRFAVPEQAGATPVEIDLQRLNLKVPLGSEDAPIAPRPDPSAGPDPATFPGLVLDVADLRLNEARLGHLRARALHGPEGLQVTELSLRGGSLELDSAGHWSRGDSGFLTQLGGRVSTEDLGDLLVDLGYSRQVEGAGGSVEFLLQWPGSPIQYHRATVRGRVGLDVGAGRLADLDPGVTRVVGLLNLNALTRRLRLDFSDIYKKGYSFDSIKGGFRFARGKAATDDLTVLGPTGRIDLSGSADLTARTLDQKVTVTPNLDATLPIASAIAGGPVAGIAVLLAQKVMTRQVDDINRFEYSLTGPWGEPEVKQLSSGGTLSKILQPFAGGEGDGDASPDAGAEAAGPPGAGAETAPPQAAAEASAGVQGPVQAPAPAAAADESGKGGPLRGLLDILKKGRSHGGDIPGAGN